MKHAYHLVTRDAVYRLVAVSRGRFEWADTGIWGNNVTEAIDEALARWPEAVITVQQVEQDTEAVPNQMLDYEMV